MEMSGQLHSPAAFIPEKSPNTSWIGVLVVSRVSVDSVAAVVQRKMLCLFQESNPGSPQSYSKPLITYQFVKWVYSKENAVKYSPTLASVTNIWLSTIDLQTN